MMEIYSDPEFGDGVHKFGSTGDAYDFCQTSEHIKDGDTLVVGRESVVGLAWTWPVAVTMEAGKLHVVNDGGLLGVMVDAGWTADQVKTACMHAIGHGYELDSQFKAWYEEHRT